MRRELQIKNKAVAVAVAALTVNKNAGADMLLSVLEGFPFL